MPRSAPPNYRLGSLYSVAVAFLLATQEPFSFLAAKRLSTLQFVFLTQIALMISIPLVVLLRRASRRDFVALLGDVSNYWKLAVLFAIGLVGLVFYNLGLGKSNPVIISAIVNLSPFWAALVALLIMRVPFPVSPVVFFGCFLGAFAGAMLVAWSQTAEASRPTLRLLEQDMLRGGWLYAVPVPICTALGGTLIGKWLSNYDESAAVAANFLVSNVILIPATLIMLYSRSKLDLGDHATAIALMIAGTIIAGSVGRVVYQVALTVTGGDNGFVMMFSNLVPALTAFISAAMSFRLAELHFAVNSFFFVGLALSSGSLLFFSLRCWRQPSKVPSPQLAPDG